MGPGRSAPKLVLFHATKAAALNKQRRDLIFVSSITIRDRDAMTIMRSKAAGLSNGHQGTSPVIDIAWTPEGAREKYQLAVWAAPEALGTTGPGQQSLRLYRGLGPTPSPLPVRLRDSAGGGGNTHEVWESEFRTTG